MSLFSRLVLGAPRTAAQIAPTLDLARGVICDLGRTDTRATAEQRLGPATGVGERRAGRLVYPQIGLWVNVAARGTITGFSVFFADATAVWPALPAETAMVQLLGAPTKRDLDDEEIMLQYERADGTWIGIDYALDGQTVNNVFIDFE